MNASQQIKSVGISAISVYVPKLYLDLTGEWAEQRAEIKSPEGIKKMINKAAQGIGIKRISQADFHEDAVTMAANAVRKLIEDSGIDPREIASIAVGTESSVDQSKSMASYVLGLIERYFKVDLSHVSCPHYQFACIGATYALESALSTILAGTSQQPYHIVVATDIAKYPLGSTGEPTQGAGAVAMLVCENPKLIEIEAHSFATCTMDESDFFRPNFAKSAVVDGKRSITVYCDALEKATQIFLSKKINHGWDYSTCAAYLYHVPFPKMAEYAAVRQLHCLWKNDQRRAEFMAQIKSDSLAAEELKIRRHSDFKQIFEDKVKSSLFLPEQIGNIYSGSLYLALASLIEHAIDQAVDLSGRDVMFSSYGSGACAKVFRGHFTSTWQKAYRGKVFQEVKDVIEGGRRSAITYVQYEKLHQRAETVLIEKPYDLTTKVEESEIMSVVNLNEKSLGLLQPHASLYSPSDEFYLKNIGVSSAPEHMDIGYRYYSYTPLQKIEG